MRQGKKQKKLEKDELTVRIRKTNKHRTIQPKEGDKLWLNKDSKYKRKRRKSRDLSNQYVQDATVFTGMSGLKLELRVMVRKN